MIPHRYINASDDLAQYEADQIGRQEVTLDWFIENGIENDIALWAWVSDEAAKFGLDPWRLIELDQVKPWHRLFVQKNQLERVKV